MPSAWVFAVCFLQLKNLVVLTPVGVVFRVDGRLAGFVDGVLLAPLLGFSTLFGPHRRLARDADLSFCDLLTSDSRRPWAPAGP